MKSRLLIIIPIIVGFAISLPFLLESSRSLYQESNENTFRYEIETDFLNKIRDSGDDSNSMTFVVISKQDLFNRHENYCGHAHMEVEEYWYFADTLNDVLLSSNVTQDVSPWCEDDDDSCYCELREFIGVDTRSYEDFFRDHVSQTCPVIPMPENATSFDPTKCEWIENENIECNKGFKAVDGVCKQLGKISEKDIPIFFEIQLMELGIEWELADRSWANPDFEIEPPARVCSHIIKDSGAELYISTIWQDEYSLSDMIIHREMPDDCVKFLPVSQIVK